MSDNNEEKMRAEFEYSVLSKSPSANLVRHTDGDYVHEYLNIRYEDWKACAAIKDSVIVALTEQINNWTRRSESCESKLGQLEANEEVMRLQEAMASRDAEIERISTHARAIEKQRHAFKDTLDIAENERASCDLMINELREALTVISTCEYDEHHIAVYEANDALAKSEHHDSRALEKMLLEAELRGLNTSSWFEWKRRADEVEAKLAELNKGK